MRQAAATFVVALTLFSAGYAADRGAQSSAAKKSTTTSSPHATEAARLVRLALEAEASGNIDERNDVLAPSSRGGSRLRRHTGSRAR